MPFVVYLIQSSTGFEAEGKENSPVDCFYRGALMKVFRQQVNPKDEMMISEDERKVGQAIKG